MEYTFYRIHCKNPEITECYIGSTKDLNDRKKNHKSTCNSEYKVNYNIKVYQFIRSNGGFDEFEFEIIDKIICCETDRLLYERRFIEMYGATLNVKTPILTDEERIENRHKYKAEHTEEIKEKGRKYYIENQEIIKEKSRQYREEHRAELREKKHKYIAEHREEINEKKRQRRLQKKLEKNK